MKKNIIYIIPVLLISAIFVGNSIFSEETYPPEKIKYKVIRVVDGDTIVIFYNGKRKKVRLLCVDTPESVHPDKKRNTPLGRRASKYTKKRLLGKYISLVFEKKKKDYFKRLLAYVFIDNQNFNIELVKKGWSPYYIKYGKSKYYHKEFLAAENYAKRKKLRYWSEKRIGEREKTTGN